MSERVVRFGADGGLVGILGEPAAARAGAPAVVFLNAGLLHRAGPFDWYTALARRLTAAGHVTLRFDLAGVGDSAVRNDPRPEVERALEDVRAAADFLASRGSGRLVLLGLCSGAMFAHEAAVRDPRVAGAVFLDGYGYRTFGFHLRYYLPRLRQLGSWLGAGRRLLGRLVPALGLPRDPLAPQFEDYFLDFPPRAKVRGELQALLARGAHLLFLYTGGLAHQYFNDARQFREMFGSLDASAGRLQVEYDARADHLYSDLGRREAMFANVETFLGPLVETRALAREVAAATH